MNFFKDFHSEIKMLVAVFVVAVVVSAGAILVLKSFHNSTQVQPELQQVNVEAEPTEEPSIDRPSELTIEQVKNADYYINEYNTTVRLRNGYYGKENYPEEGMSLYVIIRSNGIVLEDLDNDGIKEGIVILSSAGVGTGESLELVIVSNENGLPKYRAGIKLENKIIIKRPVSIQSGEIVMTTFDPYGGLIKEEQIRIKFLNGELSYVLGEHADERILSFQVSPDKQSILDKNGMSIVVVEEIKRFVDDYQQDHEEYAWMREEEIQSFSISDITVSPDETKIAISISSNERYTGLSFIFNTQTRELIFLDPDVNYARRWGTFPTFWSPDSRFIIVNAVGFESENSDVVFDIVEKKRISSIWNNLNFRTIIGWSSNKTIDYLESDEGSDIRWRFDIYSDEAVRVDSN